MILFWLLAAAMLLVVLAIILPPLFTPVTAVSEGTERDHLNISIYQDQLKELQAEFDSGDLDGAQLERARIELKRELLDEVDGTVDVVRSAGRGVRAVGLFVTLAMPLMAVGLYYRVGDIEMVSVETQAAITQQEDAAHSSAEVGAMVDDLAAKLRQSPDNREGWEMLGRTFVAMERFGDAAEAYSQVYRLDSENPDVMADYAEALAMRDGGAMLGAPLELVGMALARQPMHEKSLWLAGIAAFQNSDMETALRHWENLVGIIGFDHPNRAVLDDLMAQARNALGIEAPVASAAAATGGASISVTVNLAPALAARVGPNDTLFVFARAANGPRVPLAIYRAGAAGFPVTVTLDDSLAMAPNFKLSGFDRVTIGARISSSGNATPQPGDLKGELGAVVVADTASVVVDIVEVVGEQGTATPAAPVEPVPAPAPAAAADASITVDVSLDPALAGSVAPEDTLYIFARAESGPRLPLAIVRTTADKLPMTVTLDDSQAMAPNFRLSGFERVNIGVRISKSGNATPQPGDLSGSAEGIRVGVDHKVAVTISEQL